MGREHRVSYVAVHQAIVLTALVDSATMGVVYTKTQLPRGIKSDKWADDWGDHPPRWIRHHFHEQMDELTDEDLQLLCYEPKRILGDTLPIIDEMPEQIEINRGNSDMK